jgi:hypothetical protein
MARASASGRAWLVLAAVSAGALAWHFAEPLDLRQDRSFEISADPATKVIEVHHVGGMIRTSLSFEIYGDGRLVCTRDLRAPGRDPLGRVLFEDRIPRSELLAIFDDLTRSNVLEADWTSMRARLHGRGSITDSVSTIVILRLSRYRQRVAGPSGSIKFQMGLYAIGFNVQRFPEIEELAALGRLVDRLEIIRRSWPAR